MMLTLDNLVDNAIRYSAVNGCSAFPRGVRDNSRDRGAGSAARASRRRVVLVRRHSCAWQAGARRRQRVWPRESSAESVPITKGRSCSTVARARTTAKVYLPISRLIQWQSGFSSSKTTPRSDACLAITSSLKGYRVDAVSDCKSAINYVRASAPDLVVLASTLPDFEASICARCCGNRQVPIIILSAAGRRPTSSVSEARRRRLHHPSRSTCRS